MNDTETVADLTEEAAGDGQERDVVEMNVPTVVVAPSNLHQIELDSWKL